VSKARTPLSLACGESSRPEERNSAERERHLRWGPYRAFFYSNEGDEPAHIHVRAGSKEVKFWLHDLAVAVNMGFPVHELGDIIRHLRSHREQLLAAWNDYFGD
jgi:Domain of unknown function (DUF4160)